MPQNTRLSIGFSEESIERLRALTESVGQSQRTIVSALLELPEDQIREQVERHVSIENERKLKRRADNAALKKLVKKLTPDQLEKIKEIVNG